MRTTGGRTRRGRAGGRRSSEWCNRSQPLVHVRPTGPPSDVPGAPSSASWRPAFWRPGYLPPEARIPPPDAGRRCRGGVTSSVVITARRCASAGDLQLSDKIRLPSRSTRSPSSGRQRPSRAAPQYGHESMEGTVEPGAAREACARCDAQRGVHPTDSRSARGGTHQPSASRSRVPTDDALVRR
jgi:hypothetical protein